MFNKLKNFIGQKLISFFWKSNCRLTPMYNERICEYAFVLTRCKSNRGKVADFGCAGSLLVPYLSSLGFEVYGIDIQEGCDAAFIHNYANYSFVKANLIKLPFPEQSFDISFSISTLEHMITGAKKALEEIVRVTKKNGQIFITMPYGSGEINNVYRNSPHTLYNEKTLNALLNIPSIKIEEAAYFKRQWPVWIKSERKDVEHLDGRYQIQGVVCLSLLKP